MNLGSVFPVAADVLGPFCRVFRAVLTPVPGQEIGATPADPAVSSGLWFMAFALVPFPARAAPDCVPTAVARPGPPAILSCSFRCPCRPGWRSAFSAVAITSRQSA